VKQVVITCEPAMDDILDTWGAENTTHPKSNIWKIITGSHVKFGGEL